MSGLFVVYRSTGPDRFPRRPPYFDKLLCLRSFLLSFRRVGGEKRILFLNDGPVPDERVALMRRWGSVIDLPGLGNGPSFRRAVESALAMPDGTVAYLAEDDYLYLEPALERVTGVFAGHLKITNPNVAGGIAGILTPRLEATIRTDLTVRLLSTQSGGTVWRQSAWATQKVGGISIEGGQVVFGARDPKTAYGPMVNTIVNIVTRELWSTWQKQ